MGKTLATLMAIGAGFLPLSGCTPEGNALGQSLAIGGIQSYVSSWASERGRVNANPANAVPPQTKVEIYNPPQTPAQPIPQKLPENVILKNGKYSPAPGYQWLDNSDPEDLRVVPAKKITPVPYGLHSLVKISDNGDGELSVEDLEGFNKKIFQEEDDNPNFILRVEDSYRGNITWQISPPKGDKIELIENSKRNNDSGFFGPIFINKKAAINGEYTVSAITNDGKTHSMKVEIKNNREKE